MAYDERSVYNKYSASQSSESSDDCGCGKENDCSCCPPGTVEVYDDDGNTRGCLTPNDAEIYNNGLHIPAEGYVKVIDPVTGKYLGDLPTSQAIEYMNYLSTGSTVGGAEKTFNILTPELANSGFFELSYALLDGVTNDIDILIDRVGMIDAITVSITNSVEDIQFMPSGTVTVIAVGASTKTISIKWTGIAVAGVYTFILSFSTNTVTKQIPVQLTLS